jgi:predicted helicase
MNQNGDPAPGILTTHDEFAISWTREDAIAKVERLLATNSEEEARSIWRLCSQDQWNYERAKRELASGEWRERVAQILYRPFDVRWTVYDRNVAVHRRERVFDHFGDGNNIGLVLSRVVEAGETWQHAFPTTLYTGHHAVSLKEVNYVVPLWLRPALFRNDPDARTANFSPQFLATCRERLGLSEVDPEELFAYIYAVLYLPSYRERYGEFLRRDFPRIAVPEDLKFFRDMAAIGAKLIDLHLMRSVPRQMPSYPVAGSNEVIAVKFKNGQVHVNPLQHFGPVSSAVWEMRIGGYQVAEKWLKDRAKRLLTFDDLDHYRRVLGALHETLKLQEELVRLAQVGPK